MDHIIQTFGLSKVYDGKTVVTDVDMHVKKGEIYGFLGENGSGKSTVMKMIMNLVVPTTGSIEVFGQDVQQNHYELLKRIGCIIEEPIFYRKLTVMENLILHCEYMGDHDRRQIREVLGLVNLHGAENKKVSQLSLGMKQRLAIGRAILTKPELLILDEPINGLDPSGIKEMRLLLAKLREEYGVTILISSHILSEIEQTATTVGVLANHHLVKEVSMQQIHHLEGAYLEVQVDDVRKTGALLESGLHIRNYKISNEDTIRIYDKEISRNAIMKLLMDHKININGIAKKDVSLEDYFLSLVEEG